MNGSNNEPVNVIWFRSLAFAVVGSIFAAAILIWQLKMFTQTESANVFVESINPYEKVLEALKLRVSTKIAFPHKTQRSVSITRTFPSLLMFFIFLLP